MANAGALDATTVGTILRAIRGGVQQSVLSIASDPKISVEDKGRYAQSLSFLHDAIAEAFDQRTTSRSTQLPKLKRQ